MENKIDKKKSKKGCLVGLVIFTVTLILMVSGIYSLKEKPNKEDPTKVATTKEDTIALRFNEDGSFKLDADRGSDEAITEMYNKAKEDCDKYDNIPTIIENMNGYMYNPWENQNTMEQLIYFGTVIYKNKYSSEEEKKIGDKFMNVVKYVYRGAETIDAATPGRNILIDKLKEYRK